MKLTLKDMILCSLFAALISVIAYVSIPAPGGVPFSLQPLMAMLTGAIIGSKRGAISMTVYALLGAIGLPVFANGTGGMKVILGPTGGFIIGFIFAAFVVGLIVEMASKSKRTQQAGYIIAPFVGLAVIYLIGLPYFYVVVNFINGGTMDIASVLKMFSPYMLLDLAKAIMVSVVAISLIPKLKTAGVLN